MAIDLAAVSRPQLTTSVQAALGIAAFAFAAGVLSYLRIYTYWLRWYSRSETVFVLRNAVFAWIPAALSFSLLALGGAIHLRDGSDGATNVGVLFVLAGFASFIIFFWFLARPPERIKPRWLDQENGGTSTRGRLDLTLFPPVILLMAIVSLVTTMTATTLLVL